MTKPSLIQFLPTSGKILCKNNKVACGYEVAMPQRTAKLVATPTPRKFITIWIFINEFYNN